MLKAELRAFYKNKRLTLSQDEVLSFSDDITERLIASFEWKSGSNIHVFLPIVKLKEYNTLPFIEWCWRHNLNVFVPRMLGTELLSVPYKDDTITEINSWGIPEPVVIDAALEHPRFDAVITPLLYADPFGNRIGYGKGFYDRLFASINRDAVKLGINYFNPSEIIEDVDTFDIPLDYLVTPTDKLSFGLTSKFKK